APRSRTRSIADDRGLRPQIQTASVRLTSYPAGARSGRMSFPSEFSAARRGHPARRRVTLSPSEERFLMPHRLLHLTIAAGLIIAAPFAASATEDPLPAWEKLAPDMNDAFSGLGTPEAADGDDNVWIKGTF